MKKPKAIVTSGPTRERIDPVRYISNDSSGKQGHAIAEELRLAGYEVVLISGVTNLSNPEGVRMVHIETAEEMLTACVAELPADLAVCAAAVSDWRVEYVSKNKIKKEDAVDKLTLNFVKTPDILSLLARCDERPELIVGFAAETENLIENAQKKLHKKACDIIIANDVGLTSGVFGGDLNEVCLITQDKVETWPKMSKNDVAKKLVKYLKERLK